MKTPTFYAVFTLLLLLLALSTRAHKPGDEFAYLSMFLKPGKKQTPADMDSMYQAYSLAPTGSSSRFSRRLHHIASLEAKPKSNAASPLPDISAGMLIDEGGDTLSPAEISPKPAENAAANVVVHAHANAPANTPKKPKATDIEDGSDAPLALASRQGEDVERLTQMVIKLVRQYRITSIVDVPCRAHAHWMPDVLQALSKADDIAPNFRYVCVDTNHRVLESLRKRLMVRSLNRGTRFVMRQFWKEQLPKADLVLSWAGLDNMSEKNVRSFFEQLAKSKSRHKLVLVGSHTGDLVKSGDTEKLLRFTNQGHPINVRREPFHLKKPLRIIKEVATDGNDKQMYIYFPDSMLTL